MSRDHAARWRVQGGGDMAAAAHQEMVLVCMRSRWRQAGVVRYDRLLMCIAVFLFVMLQCIIKVMMMLLLLLLLLLYMLLLIHEKLHADKIVSPDIRVHRL
jgi:Ca2+/Na+ antiporter